MTDFRDQPNHPDDRPSETSASRWSNLASWFSRSQKQRIFDAELDKIVRRRQVAGVTQSPAAEAQTDGLNPAERLAQEKLAARDDLIGLSLSGGGIRSGAFSLGVLETLQRLGIAQFVDYLSTVSGGGYAGAFWSSRTLSTPPEREITSRPDGRLGERMLRFLHSGNYLAKTVSFFNRFLPGLVLVLTLSLSGLIALASGLAYLFRELDQPARRDAIAALGFDDDFLASIFPAICLLALWSLAWLGSYWKFGARCQARTAGVLFWPLMVCALAACGLLLGTGDLSLPFVQQQLIAASPDATTASRHVPNGFWYLIYSVVGAALLPYLRLPTLVRSGTNPRNAMEKYTFRIASAALLVGVPFVAFSLFAREDVSGYLKKRGPEVAPADLFAGLNAEQRQGVFAVLRAASAEDELDVNAHTKLRECLKQLGLKDAQIRDVVNLSLRYLYDETLYDFKNVLSELQQLSLPTESMKVVPGMLRDIWKATRDWEQLKADLAQMTEKLPTTNSPLKIEVIQAIAEQYLKDEIPDKTTLLSKLQDQGGASSEQATDIAEGIRTLWPPAARTTRRQESQIEEIRPIIRRRESEERQKIQSVAWKFATIESYLQHHLRAELEALRLKPSEQDAIYDIAKNYWPPHHADLIEAWEKLVADQAVLELPRTTNETSDEWFAGAAVAREKMSMAQRGRYLLSFLFNWGLTPLVEEEASGIKHNPLHRIWTVRQNRRAVEEEIVKRLNGQVLSNPRFAAILAHWILNEETPPSSPAAPVANSTSPYCHTATAWATHDDSEEALLTPLSQKFDGALERTARAAWQAGQHWDDLLQRRRSGKNAELADDLKDNLASSVPLTRLEAGNSVRREQLRQDLIRANREFLEAYLSVAHPRKDKRTASLHVSQPVYGRTVLASDQADRLWFFWRASIVFLISLLLVDMNATSLHGFYRERIAENWIEPAPGVGREMPLAQLDTTARGAPYHLISASLNLLGRRHKDQGNTRADHFLFSELYCGADPVGYASTSEFDGGQYKLADAVAVSGAAVSPAQNQGLLIRALLFLGNLRLGQWLPNPAFRSWWPGWMQSVRFAWPVTPGRLLLSFRQPAERRPFVFITDGGHHDNLGIGPLLERRCRLILAFDAGADEHFDFADLANLVRWSRLEHGVRIEPLDHDDLQELVPTRLMDPKPDPTNLPAAPASTAGSVAPKPANSTTASPTNKPRFARRHWIAARIEYPAGNPTATPTSENRHGLLIYLKANLTDDEPFDVLRYARTHDQFPHDTTVDQLYDPEQFASYEQLGSHIAEQLQKLLTGEVQPEEQSRLQDLVTTDQPLRDWMAEFSRRIPRPRRS